MSSKFQKKRRSGESESSAVNLPQSKKEDDLNWDPKGMAKGRPRLEWWKGDQLVFVK